ncbi:hypothetical protein HK098_004594, partial [Nowakowskiella sp. JEL0407]
MDGFQQWFQPAKEKTKSHRDLHSRIVQRKELSSKLEDIGDAFFPEPRLLRSHQFSSCWSVRRGFPHNTGDTFEFLRAATVLMLFGSQKS